MSGKSSGGFVHGALIGGGVVFFVAGMIIFAGIPGGLLPPSTGGTDNGTMSATMTETIQTNTQATKTTKPSQSTTEAQETTKSKETTRSSTTTPTTTTTTTTAPPSKSVVYRVNVGGKRLPMPNGPAWTRDTERRPSRFGNARVSSSHTNSTDDRIATTNAVPSGTPEAMFQSRRYDLDNPSNSADDTEMQYRFPVEDGTYVVRIYFAETYLDDSGWNANYRKGPRKFDVEIEGKTVLDNYDMYAELGHDRGTMKSFRVQPNDGVINVRFLHEQEDPMPSGIEVVRVNGGNRGDENRGNDRGDDDDDSDWWGDISVSDSALAVGDSTVESVV